MARWAASRFWPQTVKLRCSGGKCLRHVARRFDAPPCRRAPIGFPKNWRLRLTAGRPVIIFMVCVFSAAVSPEPGKAENLRRARLRKSHDRPRTKSPKARVFFEPSADRPGSCQSLRPTPRGRTGRLLMWGALFRWKVRAIERIVTGWAIARSKDSL